MYVRDSSSIRFTSLPPQTAVLPPDVHAGLSDYGQSPSSPGLSYLRTPPAATNLEGFRAYGSVYPDDVVPTAHAAYTQHPPPRRPGGTAEPGTPIVGLPPISAQATAAALNGLLSRRQSPHLTATGEALLAFHGLPAIETAQQLYARVSQAFDAAQAQARQTGRACVVACGESHESLSGISFMDIIGRIARQYHGQTGKRLPVFLEEQRSNWSVYEVEADNMAAWGFDPNDRASLARLWRQHRGRHSERDASDAVTYHSLRNAPVDRHHIDEGELRGDWNRNENMSEEIRSRLKRGDVAILVCGAAHVHALGVLLACERVDLRGLCVLDVIPGQPHPVYRDENGKEQTVLDSALGSVIDLQKKSKRAPHVPVQVFAMKNPAFEPIAP